MFDVLGFLHFCAAWLLTFIIYFSPAIVLGSFVYAIADDIIGQKKRDKKQAEWLSRVRNR